MTGGGFSVNLLLGVTGSGKTEVYLQCIRQVIEQGKRAIVLVPEIALTPQTVRRFTARFPNVAILHSGLTATERHRYWQQISMGQAQVVVGARSAVFAPVPDLGMIVVDEEHEASYKQDQAPRYHGRDVAIKRAQIEGVPVLLGSATPSLETYHRVGGAHAKNRAVGAPVTEQRLRSTTDCRSTQTTPLAKSSAAVSPPHASPPRARLADAARRTGRHEAGEPIPARRASALAAARTSAAHHARSRAPGDPAAQPARLFQFRLLHVLPERDPVQVLRHDDDLSPLGRRHTRKRATLREGVHTGQLHCHYCLAVNPLPDKCPHCGKKLSLFGLGTQRVEEELARKFPDLKFARVDSDTMRSSKDYEALLGRFAKGEIQVMLGTQMIAKGLDYPNVTLVGVISGDTALALPDFRAAERTFQLITQVAGRAGRGDAPGRVVLQTFLPDDPTIQAAIRQDFVGFAKTELVSRREVGLPPFARMVRIVLRDQDSGQALQIFRRTGGPAFRSHGGCERRRHSDEGPDALRDQPDRGVFPQPDRADRRLRRRRCSACWPPCAEKGHLAKNERIAVDVDPVSLL